MIESRAFASLQGEESFGECNTPNDYELILSWIVCHLPSLHSTIVVSSCRTCPLLDFCCSRPSQWGLLFSCSLPRVLTIKRVFEFYRWVRRKSAFMDQYLYIVYRSNFSVKLFEVTFIDGVCMPSGESAYWPKKQCVECGCLTVQLIFAQIWQSCQEFRHNVIRRPETSYC